MKGNQEVIAYMNELLAGELAARDQYFIHSRMYAEWGYNKLFERIGHEMEDETQHAEAFIRRILMLEGTPNMVPAKITVGKDVVEMLKADLNTEYEVRDHLKKGIALCEEKQDYVTRDLLVGQLKDTEEDHAHWLEQQLHGFASAAPADVQATLTAFTAQACADSLRSYADHAPTLLVCGGGALNGRLMAELQQRLPQLQVLSTASQGLPPLQVEAAAFAWLARQCMLGLPGNLPAVTGAAGPRVLGAIYPA